MLAISVFVTIYSQACRTTDADAFKLSFEDAQDLTGWHQSDWQQGQARVSRSDATAREGRYSLLIERNDPNGYSAWSSPGFDLSVRKGELLRAVVWCRALTRSATYEIELQPGGKKLRQTYWSPGILGMSEEGRILKIKWVADKDYDKLNIRLFAAGQGQAFFDNLQVAVIKGSKMDFFEEEPYHAQHPFEDIASAVKDQAFVLFATPATKKVYPNYIPSQNELVTQTLQVAATAGEYEPLCLGIHSITLAGQLTLEVGDLSNRGGEIFDHSDIEIRRTRMMPLRLELSGYDYTVGPKILEKDKALDIQKGQTGQFWLTFRVPPGTSPGKYAGKIRVKRGEQTLQTLSLELNIHAFELIDPPVARYMWTGWFMRDFEDNPEKIRARLVDMKNHGMTTIVVSLQPELAMGHDGRLLMDFGWIDKGLEVFKSVFTERRLMADAVALVDQFIRYEIRPGWPIGQEGPEYESPLRWRLFEYGYATFFDHLSEQGIEPLMYVTDEPATHPWRETGIAMIKHGKKIRPQARIAITTNEEFAQTMNDYIDVNVYAHFDQNFDPENAREFSKKSNDDFWLYGQCWSNRVNAATMLRYEAGFYAWRYQAEGIGWWTYIEATEDGYDDLDGQAQDFIMSYETGGQHDPTINWEALREGIDDMKYLYTLEHFLQMARNGAADKESEAIVAGAALLEEIRKKSSLKQSYTLRDDSLKGILGPAQFDAYRQRIALAIGELRAITGPSQ